MPIPDFQSLMLPVLEALSDGRDRLMRALVDDLATRFNLTQEELQ
jgi:restriction system protein